jgi:hypothetical protein
MKIVMMFRGKDVFKNLSRIVKIIPDKNAKTFIKRFQDKPLSKCPFEYVITVVVNSLVETGNNIVETANLTELHFLTSDLDQTRENIDPGFLQPPIDIAQTKLEGTNFPKEPDNFQEDDELEFVFGDK